jgi:hypothetical protein
MKRNYIFATLSILVFSITPILCQERFVMPVDEAKQNASFLAFRTKLIAAVERKDAAYVLSIIDPKIDFSFGGEAGIADFKKEWKQLNKNSEFWDEFAIVIKNGGAFTGEGRNRLNSFSAPYLFTQWPENLGDVFEYHAIFGNNVNLRKEPNASSEIAGVLSYNVVKIDEDKSIKRQTGLNQDYVVYDWYYVETLGGKKGFVKSEFVRSQLDYRAGFQKKRGIWKLIFFIAGD